MAGPGAVLLFAFCALRIDLLVAATLLLGGIDNYKPVSIDNQSSTIGNRQ